MAKQETKTIAIDERIKKREEELQKETENLQRLESMVTIKRTIVVGLQGAVAELVSIKEEMKNEEIGNADGESEDSSITPAP